MYNNLCVPQKSICKVCIAQKGISNLVILGNRPGLLGITDCENLRLLSMNGDSTIDDKCERQINDQIKKDKSKRNKTLNINSLDSENINQETQ